MHIPTIITWVVSAVVFLYGDYWSRDVAPAWSQRLLGASADHRVRPQGPAVLLANNTTTTATTMTAWVTVMATPTWPAATAPATMQPAESPIAEISTSVLHFQHSATPDASVIAFVLALVLCCSLTILGRQMLLPRAIDVQPDCAIMAAHISQQNLYIEEMGHMYATSLARLHRQLQATEAQNAELQGKAAEHDKATLGLRGAETAVATLQLEVESARNEALAAGWQAEEKAALTIDGLRGQLRASARGLAAAERTIQARDGRIAELEAANEASLRAATAPPPQDSGEVRSLRDTVSALEADLAAAREDAWDAADKAKRSDDDLRAEVRSLGAALEEQKRSVDVQASAELATLRAACDERDRILQTRDDAIAALKAELDAANMKAALADVPSFVCKPAGSQQDELRARLAAVGDQQSTPAPPVPSVPVAPAPPVVMKRRPRPVTSALRPMQRPAVKKTPAGEGSSGGAPRGPQLDPRR